MLVVCSSLRTAIAASVVALASSMAVAQIQTDTHNYSSSTDYKAYIGTEDFAGASLASPANGSPAPQYGGGRARYPEYRSRWSQMAFEAGGGFTAPTGNGDPYITYGGNVTVGAGWNFNKWAGMLAEYQFNRNKIPGATLSGLGVPGGNVNTWSLTLQPIVYLPMDRTKGVYVTGGGGFYRKVTNFTEPVAACYYNYYYGYICGYQNQTVYHFSSNQGGMNIGAGFYWKAFGENSNAKLFAEARYVWLDTPKASTSQPLAYGAEELIPVTFGVRF